MSHRKQPERRTFLQDRFEILIKRQKKGSATLSELTELDAIINGDPKIRDKIIRESMLIDLDDEVNGPSNSLKTESDLVIKQVEKQGLSDRIKSLVARIFHLQISGLKTGNLIIGPKLLSLL